MIRRLSSEEAVLFERRSGMNYLNDDQGFELDETILMNGTTFRGLALTTCRVLGVVLFGWSVLMSFTALPVLLVTALIDGGGDCDEVPYGLLVVFLCFVPGAIGSALIFLEKKLREKPVGKLTRYFLILLTFQILCVTGAFVLESPKEEQCQKSESLAPEDFENLQKIIRGR